ncbi:MoaD/ThiS family protein [Rugamonas aquatica]|uniref:Molybdopterin synthase sulfur carrier subunit n=1 Tax=Rugamonas aquatica TaxID=2743357 RepID=A0A6A7MVX7_9BURK|nr:MoaD/ThiS family protein [Rugamonas aquatica]MQA36684.1 molybdopterin synthase sulfur carrier subunit [Rugamonas aquatica]
MSVQVHLPTIMRTLTEDQKTVVVSGTSIQEVIHDLERNFPGMQGRLMQDGQLHRFVNIYLNDDDIRFQQGLASPVKPGDAITILPAVAGG